MPYHLSAHNLTKCLGMPMGNIMSRGNNRILHQEPMQIQHLDNITNQIHLDFNQILSINLLVMATTIIIMNKTMAINSKIHHRGLSSIMAKISKIRHLEPIMVLDLGSIIVNLDLNKIHLLVSTSMRTKIWILVLEIQLQLLHQ